MRHEPARYLVLDEFLDADERQVLVDAVCDESADWEAAMVNDEDVLEGTRDASIRRASVLQAFDGREVLERKIEAILPHVRRELGVPRFEPGPIEMQLVAYADGDHFIRHSDHGPPWSVHGGRRISFVYYFHEHPRPFEGGELKVFCADVADDGTWHPSDEHETIAPDDNTIVFFPSTAQHQVEPVRTGEPGAVRFGVTGWCRDGAFVVSQPELSREHRNGLTRRYVPSFTEHGFEKIKTPPAFRDRLRELYDTRIGATYTEPDIPPEYLPSGSPDFIDIDDVKAELHEELRGLHEAWAGTPLEPTACYGLRVYRRGHSLLPHTDRTDTHVISSIVHIAHTTDEPWPLSFEDLHGVTHEVVLEEDEMLLYESARCIHGRPTPLPGDAYCSLFLHYRPPDWDIDVWKLVEAARADGADDLLPVGLRPQRLVKHDT